MHKLRCLFVLLALWCAEASAGSSNAQSPPTRVMVVGLFHFDNPGRDLFNARVDDVLAPRRQAEIEHLTRALARFEPDSVLVEWPAGTTDERYAQYRDGTLPPSRNEVVQLGFRLAAERGLSRVHGIDVPGEFPFDAVQAFAVKSDRAAELGAIMKDIGVEVEDLSRRIEKQDFTAVLRHMNQPERLLRGHGVYMRMLRFGQGDEQPGAALVSAWYARNLAICARLVQTVPAGGRAVVFYGEGHAWLLRRCIVETPGFELVEPNDYLTP